MSEWLVGGDLWLSCLKIQESLLRCSKLPFFPSLSFTCKYPLLSFCPFNSSPLCVERMWCFFLLATERLEQNLAVAMLSHQSGGTRADIVITIKWAKTSLHIHMNKTLRLSWASLASPSGLSVFASFCLFIWFRVRMWKCFQWCSLSMWGHSSDLQPQD